MTVKKPRPTPQYDRYRLYEASVQSPKSDIDFALGLYKKLRGRKPRTLREDFCGVASNAIEFIKRDSTYSAVGIDLDPEALAYSRKHKLKRLTEQERKRLTLVREDVLKAAHIKNDLTIALNFSYFIFKDRITLLRYFKSVRAALRPGGIFVMDAFGGTDTMDTYKDERRYRNFSYYWECQRFDVLTQECLYAIHFKWPRKRGKFYKNAFRYDWRHWTLPELKDLLQEAGFRLADVYWEGSTSRGMGNGVFKKVKRADNIASWLCYIVSQ